MENKSHALAAGAFVLLLAALMVALGVWLTRDTVAHMTFDLSSRESVTGLQTQAAVRFRGVNVGKVESIGFDSQVPGNVLIRIATNANAPITQSTFATLGFQGVTGLAFVQLDDTGASKEPLLSNPDVPARIPMRASLLAKLSNQGETILVQLEETSRRINLLLAPENQKTLFVAIEDIGKTAKDVSESVKGFGQAATSLQQFSANANRILDFQFGPQKMNLPKLVEDFTVTLKNLQGTSERIGATADEAKGAASDFRQAAKTLSQPGGALDKLGQSADSLSQLGQSLTVQTLPRLNRTSEDAARTLRQVGKSASPLNETPQALIFGNGALQPGPGESGFNAPGARP